MKFDGTLYVMKVACTVWSGGKIGDKIKNLPITILSLYNIHIWFMQIRTRKDDFQNNFKC